MILEHEIPDGSKLHFGLSAKIKREVENTACEIFYEEGFDEIISPVFIYGEHQKSFLNRSIIRLSNEKNHQISLRHDSTVDVIRIITKRLGRSTNQKDWFYIQPVFSYPTIELNQIGVECLEDGDSKIQSDKVLKLALKIFKRLQINPILQITNTNIPRKCVENSNLEIEDFKNLSVDKLQQVSFIKNLLAVNSKDNLKAHIKTTPSFLKQELEYLLESCTLEYENIIFSPLLPAPVDYYKDLFFRMFLDNYLFLSGGRYMVDGLMSCGFGIYTDSVVRYLFKTRDKG